jgi:hypothetical protein
VFRFTLTMTTMLLLMVVNLGAGPGVSPVIGIATAGGEFLVGSSPVSGNATLFDGTVVETGSTVSVLQLDSGARVRLGTASRGMVFRKYLLLVRGEGLLEKTGDYVLEAGNLRVRPSSSDATARVKIEENERVHVTALAGDLQVLNTAGFLLARLEAGRALEFDAHTGDSVPPFTVSGCLEKTDGRYLLKDDTAGVTFELKGGRLEASLGLRVEITGTDAGSSNTIQVTRVKPTGESCAVATGKPDGTKTAAGGAPGAGKAKAMSGTTKAVIAGVAIAGAGAGTTVGLIGREDAKKPSISH